MSTPISGAPLPLRSAAAAAWRHRPAPLPNAFLRLVLSSHSRHSLCAGEKQMNLLQILLLPGNSQCILANLNACFLIEVKYIIYNA